ncbi:hypothetical protein BsWGS_19841 [Bradybaena similaris]
MHRDSIVNHRIPKTGVKATDGDGQTPNSLMKEALMAASRQPTRLCDIRSFKNLHSPRVHRMTEWILQYECVCRRQEQYLQQIKDLRHQFRHQNGDKVKVSRYGNVPKAGTITGSFWETPPSPSTKPNDRIPNVTCILYPPKTHKSSSVYNENIQVSGASKLEANDFLMAPKSGPKNHIRQPAGFPERLGIERNKTDYEPIEHIARRNQLNFSKYFRDGQTWEQDASRETVATSDVYVTMAPNEKERSSSRLFKIDNINE